MRTLVAMLLMAAMAPVGAQEIYRWVDDDGVVHYSDQAREGAERVNIRAPMTYESTLRMDPQVHSPDEDGDTPLSYTTLRIVSPPDGEPLWATGGVYTVVVETVPALQPGHQIELSLNDTRVPGTPVATMRIPITGLIRGEHTLQAAILDDQGRYLLHSDAITFTVLQASINQPQRR